MSALDGMAVAQSSNSTSGDVDPLHMYSFNTAVLVVLMIAWITLGHKFAASTKFAGEGSAACLLGLAVGAILVVARKLFHPEMLQSMLSFDPANFFM